MSGSNTSLNARKSGDGCLLRCLLHTLSESLRGVWVPRAVTLLRVPLSRFTRNTRSESQPQDYNKPSHWVLVASPSENHR